MVFQVGAVGIRLGQRQQTSGAAFQSEATLRVDQGPDQGRVFALDNRTVVGSAEGVQIRLQSTFPQHLELARHDNGFWVRDLTGQAQAARSFPQPPGPARNPARPDRVAPRRTPV
jgi:hypothetical protein